MEALTNARRNAGAHYAKLCSCAVAMLDHRIAPEYTYPTALTDARDGWNELLRQGYRPEDIVLAGDSAGGAPVLGAAPAGDELIRVGINDGVRRVVAFAGGHLSAGRHR